MVESPHPMRSLVLLLASVVGLTAADKPNVLFLLSDDHSYPYLSCYGDANVRTPALDKLASEGMKFRRFFTSAPQCVPSRAAYLCGRSPVAARRRHVPGSPQEGSRLLCRRGRPFLPSGRFDGEG